MNDMRGTIYGERRRWITLLFFSVLINVLQLNIISALVGWP